MSTCYAMSFSPRVCVNGVLRSLVDVPKILNQKISAKRDFLSGVAGILKVEPQIYCIKLIDSATPGYVTADKNFYGTMEDINMYLSSHKLGNISYHNPPKIEPVEKVYQEWIVESDVIEAVHMNVWDCSYEFRLENVWTYHKWIKCENSYRRIVLVEAHGVKYYCDIRDEWRPVGDFWGLPDIFQNSKMLFYVDEWGFENEEMLLQDAKNFESEKNIDLTEFYNEILADG